MYESLLPDKKNIYIITMNKLKNISNFSTLSDYLPIFTGTLIADLIIIFVFSYTMFQSKILMVWYKKYGLSAVIADVFIIVIGFILARLAYPKFFSSWNFWKFASLLLVIQVVHDLLFALFFTLVPRGVNNMLDVFKDYAKENSYKAILGDSVVTFLAALFSSYLAGKTFHTQVITLIVSIYLLPYLLYAKII